MTSYEPGPNGESPMYLPPYPPRKRRVWPWVALALFVALLCGFGGVALLGAAGEKSTGVGAPIHTPSPTPQPGPSGGVAPVSTTNPDVKVGDLRLTVKTTTKDCFGSAGCNVEYQMKLAISTKVVPGDCEITYQVNGLEDPQIGTLKMHADGSYDQDSYQSGQTSSSSKKLTAKITEIDC